MYCSPFTHPTLPCTFFHFIPTLSSEGTCLDKDQRVMTWAMLWTSYQVVSTCRGYNQGLERSTGNIWLRGCWLIPVHRCSIVFWADSVICAVAASFHLLLSIVASRNNSTVYTILKPSAASTRSRVNIRKIGRLKKLLNLGLVLNSVSSFVLTGHQEARLQECQFHFLSPSLSKVTKLEPLF